MPTSYNSRVTATQQYAQRIPPQSNLYDLADVSGVNIFNALGAQIQVYGALHGSGTPYYLRIPPQSNLYDLADVSGVNIFNALGAQIQVYGALHGSGTPYYLRITP